MAPSVNVVSHLLTYTQKFERGGLKMRQWKMRYGQNCKGGKCKSGKCRSKPYGTPSRDYIEKALRRYVTSLDLSL